MRNKQKIWIPGGLLIVGLLGFMDASYLSLKHFMGGELGCSIVQGCDIVTTSVYSQVFGIPVALLGVLYYLAIMVAMITYFDRKNESIVWVTSWCTTIGLIASAYFVYLQAFVIHAWCQYCIGSAISSTLLFVLGMLYISKRKRVA